MTSRSIISRSWIRKLFDRQPRTIRKELVRLRPRLELLEDRTLPSATLPYPTASTSDQLIADINAANSAGGATTITLAAGTTFNFYLPDNKTNGGNEMPVITGNINIVGNGDTINGFNDPFIPSRLFDVAAGGSLTLENLTLSGGVANGIGAAGQGGAIYSSGTLNLNNVAVESNVAEAFGLSNAYGGGLYVANGTVTLSNSTCSRNKVVSGTYSSGTTYYLAGKGANSSGGGLYVAAGTVTLSHDTISDNTAQGGYGHYGANGGHGGTGGDGSGGGMYVAGGTVTLNYDLLSGNHALGGQGGTGSYNGTKYGRGGMGGTAGSGWGGGMDVAAGVVTLNNDTLSGNNANGGTGGYGGSAGLTGGKGGFGGYGGDGAGGGLYAGSGLFVCLANTSIANNKAAVGPGGTGGTGYAQNGSNGFPGYTWGPDVVGTVLDMSAITDQDELVNAIIDVNKCGSPIAITLTANSVFNEISADNSSNGGNALPVITGNLTILGNGDTIERTGSTPFRLFDVASGGSLTLENLTLQGGLAQGTGAAAEGGAIYSAGTLSLNGVTVGSNMAQGSNGGNGSTSVAGGPGASASGGGLYVAGGTATLVNDTFSGNIAQGGNGGSGGRGSVKGTGGAGGNGGAGSGGGLYVAGGTVTLINDTFSGNNANGGQGGNGGGAPVGVGIAGAGGAGGNGSGGGLFINSGSMIALHNTLIAENNVTAGNGGAGGKGSSIGAPGTSGSATDPDVLGNVASSDHDLIGIVDGTDSNLTSGSNGDQVGSSANPINPLLGPLADNGGPIQTMALLVVNGTPSPAIDSGDSSAPGLPSTDQRGYARIVGNAVDIGAYEYGATAATADLSVSCSAPSSVAPGGQITYTLTVTNNSIGEFFQSNVTLTDVLPANTTLVSWTVQSGWSSSAPAVGSSAGTVSAWTSSLFNSLSATFTLVVNVDSTVAGGTVISNAASVGPITGDPNPTNNSVSFQTKVLAPAAIAVTPYGVPYDGNAHTATGTATGVGGVDLSADLTLSGTTHTNAGSWVDAWSFHDPSGNYQDASGTVSDAISPAPANITVTPCGVAYDGNPHTATGTATGVGGVGLSADLILTGTTHTNAGSYADTWTFHDPSGNYQDASGTVRDTISPAPANITITPYGVAYDGNAHTATGTATGVGGVDLSADLILTGTTHTNAGSFAGSYADTWTFHDPSGNYQDVIGTVSDTIRPANAYPSATGYSIPYDGNGHTAVASATDVNGNPLPASDFVLTNSVHTNVGTYTDAWSFHDPSGNYQDASGTVSDSISPANAHPSVIGYSIPYDGNAHTAAASATDVNGNPLPASDFVLTVHTNAGSWTDLWSFHDPSGNYQDASGTISDTISPANAHPSVTGYSVTYDGISHTASGGATDVNGNPLPASDFVLTATVHTNAGTYTDTWSFHDPSGNYQDASGTVRDTISRAPSTTTVGDNGGKYNGSPFPATSVQATGVGGLSDTNPADFTFSYAGTGTTSYGPSATAPTSAGTYTVTATYNGDANHQGSPSSAMPFTIGQATPTVTVSDTSNIYNGSAFQAVDTVAGVNGTAGGTLEGVGLTLDYVQLNSNGTTTDLGSSAPTLPGSYTVTASFAGSTDYTKASATTPFAIGQPTTSITPLVISTTGLAVGVPGQPLTDKFAVTYGPNGPTQGITFSINYGDGTNLPPSAGGPSVKLDHVYKAAGTFTIQVTATDPNGVVSQLATEAVTISTVALEADPSGGTALAIGGSAAGSQTIIVSATNTAGTTVNVNINGKSLGSFTPTGHLFVYGQGGKNKITLKPLVAGGKNYYIKVPAFLYGEGSGGDHISAAGSAANNVLSGQGNNEVLTGGLGRDLLIAGTGAATLNAGTGDDILIGGWTNYDLGSSGMTYDQKVAALEAVMAEWGSTDSYVTRLSDLGGLLNTTTVHDNIANGRDIADQLNGNASANDWFFAGQNDTITGKNSNDQTVTIH
jgi:uncharacterized repeat protein (TIGR01451 family)